LETQQAKKYKFLKFRWNRADSVVFFIAT